MISLYISICVYLNIYGSHGDEILYALYQHGDKKGLYVTMAIVVNSNLSKCM